ncbi:MAG: SUMF1/EgtB/PvdO family nonheme iron enzyme [Nitrospinota bacterium]|nr:SUMF1/EgtB/PvdO family nonheme iron enzyme [Nitrospinota bacterium]
MTDNTDNTEKMFCPSCEREFDHGLHFCPHDGSKLIVRSNDELAGQTLDGRYRILHKLGEGGMGKVYKAEQVATGKMVAIKIVAQHLSTDEATIRRFRREVNIQSKLEHPNIVTVIDFSQLSTGEYYFVMAFVKGTSLQNLILEEGKQDLKSFFDYAIQICDGIEYAHRLGIVHRDLKGDNIIVAHLGHQKVVKILDFGIAKALQSADDTKTTANTAQLTAQGRILGTPAYMSPEQAKGEISHIGPATDIYAIGVLMFQMLAGKLPYESDTPWGLMHKHIMAPVPHINGDSAALRELDKVVSKCLEKDPANRYQSALELKDALEHLKAEYTRPGSGTNYTSNNISATAEKTAVLAPDESLDPTVGYQTPPPVSYAEPQSDKLKTAVYAGLLVLAVVAGGAGVMYFVKGKAPDRTAQMEPVGPAAETETSTAVVEDVKPPAENGAKTPDRSPEETKAAKIQENLQTAKRRFDAGALTRPEGQSALDSYLAVLLLDPKNSEAMKGRDLIGERLVALVNEAIDKQNLGTAAEYLAQAEAHTPKAVGMKEATLRLEEERSRQAKALAALHQQEDKQKQIEALLKEGDAYFEANALDKPAGKNAIDMYKKVLAIAPGHPEANSGLEKVAQTALAQAEKAMEKKEFQKSGAHIKTALSATGSSEEALKMQERLYHAIQTEKAQDGKQFASADQEAAKARQAAEDKKRLEDEATRASQAEEEEKRHRAEEAEKESRAKEAIKAGDKKKIAALLAKAEAAFDAGRLAPPAKESAYDFYSQVLDLEPEDEQGQFGMRRIGRVLLAQAQKAVDYNEFDKAAILVDQVEEIDPTAPRLDKVRGNLIRAQKTTGKPVNEKSLLGAMVIIRGGCFKMGDNFKEGNPDEFPAHNVCLDRYMIDKYEVTQGEYTEVMKNNPSWFANCPLCPVENVKWEEASKYCAAVGKRLPTEAEWEFAARTRGKKMRFATESGVISGVEANYNATLNVQRYSSAAGGFRKKPVIVGSFPTNSMGVYDMAGNVSEWVSDWYASKYYEESPENNPGGPKASADNLKVVRGGSWNSAAFPLRVSARDKREANTNSDQIGFRCAK